MNRIQVRRFFRVVVFWTVVFSILGSIAAGVYVAYRHAVSSAIVEYAAQASATIERLRVDHEAKVADMRHKVVADLKGCESGDLDEENAPIILDSNDEISIGLLQFQRDTVIHYKKVLDGETVSRTQAARIALDAEQSYALAEKVLFETDGGWKNWWTCSQRLGLPAKIEVINELTR